MSKRKQTFDNTNTKKIKTKPTIIDEIGKMYADALYNSAKNINFHDDSGCYYETLQFHSTKIGDWLKIYQPTIEMTKYESGVYHFIFKYITPITEKQFNDSKLLIKKIDKLFLESYNDVLKKTNNKWNRKVNGTIKEVAQIVSPFRLDKGLLKIGFDLRGFEEGSCFDNWEPVKLKCWIDNINEDSYTVESDILERYACYNKDAIPAKI